MSVDSVVSIVWDVLKYAIKRYSIKRQLGYLISSESYAQDLQKEVGKLAYQADWVKIAAEEAEKNFRDVYDHAKKWQESAEKALKEAGDLLADFEKASKTCRRRYGTLPDPNCRYQFSRKAEDKIEVIKQLAQICSGFKEVNDLSFSNPTPGNVTAPNSARREGKDVVQSTTATASASSASTLNELSDDGLFESRAAIIRDIIVALADHDNSAVGIHGMGGVGKSTLLADVERRIREENSFDLVAKADVSENPDIKRIHGEIAHGLGLSNIKYKDYIRPRAERLRTRLEDEERKKKKVLIILDNLWKGLDLKSVGIPCGYDNKVMGCKLLLTSRFQDVLQREMGCDRDFRLDELKEEEAKRLFERMVGDKVHDAEFKPWVEVALHKCAGLPFLIVAMAKRLKDADLFEWEDTLKRIQRSKHEGFNELIKQVVQLSYDRLDEDMKSLLQLCVLYGGSEPSLENLVKYGVDLGLFRECSSREEARDSLRSGIRTLTASSLLLEDGDADGFKIHDLVREFVISIAPRDQRLRALNDKDKEVAEHLRA